ncbi:MAG TPA: TonB-dependent receptor [Polyangiaceae bacterium]|nr:TonB-dependent receptor [Polyangiaceae bacterium]
MSKRIALWGAAVVMTASASAHAADDTSDLQNLLSETVVVGASKSAEKGSTAPAVTTTLTADDMRRYGIRSIDEAIDFLSLGAATSNTLRTPEIGSRGVLMTKDQGDHFLLIIDGHAVNEALYGAARFGRGAGIPMEIVDRIEVILGPGSVLYGSSAMLGVINVVTKQAREFAGTHLVVESEIGKSWRAGVGGGYEFDLLKDRASVTFQLQYYRQDGPAFQVGPQNQGLNAVDNRPWAFGPGQYTGIWGGNLNNSHYAEVPSGLFTFRLKNFELRLHGSIYKRGSPFNHDFVWPESDFDSRENFERDRSIFGDARYKIPLSAVAQIQTRLYGDSFDYQRFVNASAEGPTCSYGVTTCRKVSSGASRWVGSEISASFDWLKDGSAVSLIGVDGRLRFVGSQFDVFDANSGRALADTDSVLRVHDKVFGAYAQQTWSPVTWLTLNGGARLDVDQRFGSRVSPRFAANFQVWQGGTLKGIYSEAFRAPSWQESATAFQTQILADNLRPETVRSVEGAIEQRLGTHRLLFGIFRSWWSDLVELHLLNDREVREGQLAGWLPLYLPVAATQYRNVSSIENYGFNAGYEGTFGQNRWRYGLNATGAIARRVEPGLADAPLVVAPQVFGNARIAYDLGGGWPTMALAAHYQGARPADRAFFFSPAASAPPFVEARLTITGPFPGVKGLTYRATANYSFTAKGPYVIGVGQSSSYTGFRDPATGVIQTQYFNPELIPVDRLRIGVGMQYDF